MNCVFFYFFDREHKGWLIKLLDNYTDSKYTDEKIINHRCEVA